MPDFVRRNPFAVDGFLAAALALALLPATVGGAAAPGVLAPGTAVAGLGWLWFVAVPAPLAWRRRAPVLVFWLVSALAAGSVLAGVTGAFLVVAPLFALYSVARHSRMRHLWPAAGAGVLAAGAAMLHDRPQWPTVIGIAAVLAMAVLLGLTLRQRERYVAERHRRMREELEYQAAAVLAGDRAQIAREVHDIVAHNLAVMVALANGALVADGERAADLMRKTATTGREALSEIRRLVRILRDGPADEPPEPQNLSALVEKVRAAGLPVTLTVDGQPESSADPVIYRIVQEALTNTLKHAGSYARAQVRICHSFRGTDVEIADDGAGAAPVPQRGGSGIIGITERIAAVGGTVEAGPLPSGGWRVRAHLPR